MSFLQTLRLVYFDYRRYRATGGDNEGSLLGVLLLTQGFWASTVYRFSHFITCIHPSFLRRILRVLFFFIEKWIEIITGIRIPGECMIGKGLYIGHFGPIIVHSQAKIGDFCNLSQGVTIGVLQRGERTGVPVIGNRVYIGPNAIVIGGINIGNDTAIGAGAIVTKSAADRTVLAGNPARVLSQEGSFEFIHYDGMTQDLERIASVALREVSV